jgi:hypothetical protein
VSIKLGSFVKARLVARRGDVFCILGEYDTESEVP